MVRKRTIFAFAIGLLFVYACQDMGTRSSDSLASSSGKYGEVLIVVDTSLEKAMTGQAIDEIFREPLLGLPQNESQFRAVTVPHAGFKSILKRSRNVLVLKRKAKSKKAINIVHDVWANPQLMIQVNAASDEDIARILLKNKASIRAYFNEEELKRLQLQYCKSPQTKLMDALSKDYHAKMIIPPGFVQMMSSEQGLWFKKEKTVGQHQVLQGVFLYQEPYNSENVFEVDSLIKSQNQFTKVFIEGSRDSSFFQIYDTYVPDTREVNLNGVYAMEYRGLWNMANDFMGGPFLHYSFVDESRNRVMHIGGFVFAPKFNKREYLRELEAILKTVQLNGL